jgi:para-nitrobenzyl esterase
VPLLAGTNSQEQGAQSVLGNNDPTPENLAAAIRRLYPDHPDDIVKAYAATTQDEVLDAATHLASARFIAHGTWKWTELQAKTGGKPVYRYYYTRIRPRFIGNAAFPAQTNAAPGAGRGGANAAARGGEAPAPSANAPPARGGAAAAGRRGARAAGPGGRGGPAAAARGAAHSAEIPYAMGNLDLDDRYAWEPADHKVSGTMQAYFLNFIKTGNPNGQGLPDWPTYSPGTNYQRMRIDVESAAEPEPHRDRYVALDAIYSK